MARTDLAKLTKAQLIALITATGDEPSEASQHFRDRDIPCNAAKPCTKTFRTDKGRDWHTANVKHA